MREVCTVLEDLEDAYIDIRLEIFVRRLKGSLTPVLKRELSDKEARVLRTLQNHQMEHHGEPLTEDELNAILEC
jgi:hypothetical protein